MEIKKTNNASKANILEIFSDNASWFDEHINGLRADKRYRNKYVAIDDKKVILTAKTIEGLLRKMSHLPEFQKSCTYVRFVEPNPVSWILAATLV